MLKGKQYTQLQDSYKECWCDEKMRTPLHVAMIFADDALCNLLLTCGANVHAKHAKDNYMDNPIQLAFYYGRFKLRENLLSDLPYFG